MAKVSTVFLMYHELEVHGHALCQSEPGYVRYVLRAGDFEAQMRSLQQSAWGGVSVSSALQYSVPRQVAITFDDGCETDLLAAAPILARLGFGATFYVTAGFVGTPGYLTAAQLRELSDAGFEIGCHSMTHNYLTDLDRAGLHREIVDARQNLENIIGKAVEHFSCPGGRWSRDVALTVQRAGYRSLANSEIRSNSSSTDSFALGRIAVMRNLDLPEFMRACRGESLWRLKAADTLRRRTRKLLGNRLYDRVRQTVLGLTTGD